MTRVSQTLDRVQVIFDDDNLVANAGLLLPATLSERVGLEALIDATVRLDGRVGGASPGRKVLTLMNTTLASGSHIDHADMLRAGATAKVVSHGVLAPSTLGTFLRAFSFGHVRQLETVNDVARQRVWAMSEALGGLVIGVDSTIYEVAGKHKQGADYGYTHRLGYHPVPATIAGTGEGFWNNDTIVNLARLDVRYTMAIGHDLHHDPHHPARTASRPDLSPGTAVRRAAEPTERHQPIATPSRNSHAQIPSKRRSTHKATHSATSNRPPDPDRWIEAECS